MLYAFVAAFFAVVLSPAVIFNWLDWQTAKAAGVTPRKFLSPFLHKERS